MATTMRRMTTGIMAVMLALGLALGAVALTPDGADAKPIKPGGDSFQMGCRSIQQQAQALVDEYGKKSTTAKRKREIQGELRSLGRDWNDTGCRAVFGDIFLLVPDDGPVIYDAQDITHMETAGMYR